MQAGHLQRDIGGAGREARARAERTRESGTAWKCRKFAKAVQAKQCRDKKKESIASVVIGKERLALANTKQIKRERSVQKKKR